ncbi:DNA mismatch repair protein mutS [unidentified eubacterium SCB49]|nr:DNA mismatch repair protein mutS [unidentified eubacterium SCB49]
MKNPTTFYKSQIEQHQVTLTKIKGQLIQSSVLRLSVFLAIAAAIYFFFGNTPAVLISVVVGIAAFLFLVSRHTNLQYKRDYLQQLIAINEIEIEVQNRNFSMLPSGKGYKDGLHEFGEDIDLFGEGSFFQYLNRTTLQNGSDYLATLFKENNIDRVEQKQEAIQELSKLPEWRQQFSAVAALVETETSATQATTWLSSHKSFVPKLFKIVPLIFTILSLALISVYIAGFIHGGIVVGWFLLGLGISGKYLGKISSLAAQTSKIQSTFQQYHKLISLIETQDFKSDLLQEYKSQIITDSEKASGVLHQFSRLLNRLDQRNNMLIGVVSNGFFLRDLNVCYDIEQWIAAHQEKVGHWFQVIHFFDAYNSLANYSFNHQDHSFPEIQKEGSLLQATAAAHPLLDPATAIKNDIHISEEEFFIITGANMAGKSTFLRTVALQIVMANMGLPTNAKKSSYTPIKLITSMRTTDSLQDDASYFYSELTRLKYIVDAIKEDRYFIILDEILKGTNSTDKANGSKKFIQKLVRSKSTGIIATHDLSLCTTADEFDEVKNFYFDAQIIDDELYFDYTFKNGICQNMNASFLLKKMGIVD